MDEPVRRYAEALIEERLGELDSKLGTAAIAAKTNFLNVNSLYFYRDALVKKIRAIADTIWVSYEDAFIQSGTCLSESDIPDITRVVSQRLSTLVAASSSGAGAQAQLVALRTGGNIELIKPALAEFRRSLDRERADAINAAARKLRSAALRPPPARRDDVSVSAQPESEPATLNSPAPPRKPTLLKQAVRIFLSATVVAVFGNWLSTLITGAEAAFWALLTALLLLALCYRRELRLDELSSTLLTRVPLIVSELLSVAFILLMAVILIGGSWLYVRREHIITPLALDPLTTRQYEQTIAESKQARNQKRQVVGITAEASAKVEHHPVAPSRGESAKKLAQVKPDISLLVVELLKHSGFGFALHNNSKDIVLREPTYQIALWNLDSTDFEEPLRGPAPDLRNAWIRPGESLGPYSLSSSLDIPSIKIGDRLFGWITVSCALCLQPRTYWFYGVQGKTGWISELPKRKVPAMGKIEDMLPELRKNPDAFFAVVPSSERKPTIPLP